ncbi:hypothetical protein Cni_G02666 [Canna indica]|uniref:Uncharacterized protein n=1 Tax=Canna indica TaxID=4628 RepID=A0AAQ3JT58_9LILI|nr:hypothetical protein Cni_G02666 [Canna indica]
MTVLSSSSRLLIFLFALLLPSIAASESDAALSNGTSIYDLLPQYGMPPGLLPDTVKSFSLEANGRFSVELDGSCYIDFDYPVSYEPSISGVIKYGSIEDLQGVKVRRFLIWFDVDTIKVDLPPSQYIYFQVGWITRKLGVQQFETVHSCNGNKALLHNGVEELFDWSL